MERVNIVIGRFQPITLGHMKIVEQMYDENNLPTVFCMVSNKKFDSKHPFSDDIISEELDIIMKNDKQVAGYIWITNADIVKCAEKLHEAGYEPLLWGCGTDRYDSYKKQADRYKEKAGLLPEFDVFEVKRTDDDISATKVRNAIKEDNLETFNKMMPKGVDKLWDQFKKAMGEINEHKTWVSLRDFIRESLEDDKQSLIDFINDKTNKDKIKKVANYANSLDKSKKDILYYWCWLKYPDTKKINNFYKEMKESLRSSGEFINFIDLCNLQIQNKNVNEGKSKRDQTSTSIDGYTLKSPDDKSFINIPFKGNYGSFNLKEYLKKYKNISDKVWNAIHNITFGPQPTVGKSEVLFRTISHPGNNNKYGGDVKMFNNGFEIKDFGTSSAKLGDNGTLNTDPIYEFLGITEKKGFGPENNKSLIPLIKKENLTKENFVKVFTESKYFNNEKCQTLIKNISEHFVNKIKNELKNTDSYLGFLNCWGILYLFLYSIIENFNIFIVTKYKSELCFDYNYIVLNNKDSKLFDELFEANLFKVKNIRNGQNHYIEITYTENK